jgi:hypothetical protein
MGLATIAAVTLTLLLSAAVGAMAEVPDAGDSTSA